MARSLLRESDKWRKKAIQLRGEESVAWANFALGMLTAHDRLMERAAKLTKAVRERTP
jgi:hypothetical protein